VTSRSRFWADPQTTTAGEVDEPALQGGFGGEHDGVVGAVGPDVGAFHQQHVHIGGRVGEHLVEQRGFAAVAPEIAGVEEAPPAGLDEQRVGVEGGMVVEVRGDGEGADPHRPAVLEVAGRGEAAGDRREEGGGAEDAGRFPPDVERDVRRQAGGEAVVVEVGV
jgi:hypothetical protein